MNAEAQTALNAAQAAVATAHATWGLVTATWALVVVTIVAVVVGGLAAQSANQTYRLEAEPVLVITVDTPLEHEVNDLRYIKAPRYVVTGNPALAQGLVLRPHERGDDSVLSGTNAEDGTTTPQGSSRWGQCFLQVQNAGRSPALGVEIDVGVTVKTYERMGHELVGFKPEPPDPHVETNAFTTPGTQHGVGIISLPGIPAQGVLIIRIENHLEAQAQLTPNDRGRQASWTEPGHPSRPIAILAPNGPIHLMGAR